MRKGPLAVFVAILAVAVVWVWILAGPSDDSTELRQNEPRVDSINADGGLTPVPEPVQPESLKSKPSAESKRIVHDPNKEMQDEESITGTEDQEHFLLIIDKIESALAGNIEDAFLIVSYARNCRGAPRDEDSLHSLIRSLRNEPRTSVDNATWDVGPFRGVRFI
jgi:hypothetical protein